MPRRPDAGRWRMGTTTTDIHALKSRLKATCMDANYDQFSRLMESSAVEFLDRLGVAPGARLLDVVCGSGQLALIPARRGARVTGVDIAANSIAEKWAGLTLVTYGDSEFIPAEVATHIARAIPRARMVTFNECGHFSYLECPAALRKELDDFFRRPPARAPD
jgi:pimeloyl-ACP methyl ester carboxylesterase